MPFTQSDLDQLLIAFDSDWRSGPQPEIARYMARVGAIAADGPSRRGILGELAMVDLEYRWRCSCPLVGPHHESDRGAGEVAGDRSDRPPTAADYAEHYHDLGTIDDLPVELIAHEYWARHRWGDRPPREDLLRRYPAAGGALETALARIDEQLALHTAPLTIRVRCPHCQGRVAIDQTASGSQLPCPSCGQLIDLKADPPPLSTSRDRRRVGHLELIEQVGTGAFGVVWKAYDRKLDRTVALKTAHPGRNAWKDAQMLFREARSTARLRHPNIVPVHEVGRDADTVYIASRYIDGMPLDRWMTSSRPTHRAAAELCRTMAEALEHSHGQGVVHRDLKPSNILIDGQGCPHITDFGLARRFSSDATVSLSGAVLGTPAYTSPEQALGRGQQADARSDVYALGVILFELLTGRRPFQGDIHRVIDQVVHAQPPSPRKIDPTIRRDLQTICLKCLEKDPDRRYRTAGHLAEDLARYLDGRTIAARPTTWSYRFVRWARRNRLAAALGGVLLLLAVVAAGVLARRMVEDYHRGIADAAARGRRQQQAAADLAHWRTDQLQRHKVFVAPSLLEDLDRETPVLDDFASGYLRGLLTQWRHPPNPYTDHVAVHSLHRGMVVTDIAVSPDGRLLASACTSGELRLWDLKRSRELAVFTDGDPSPKPIADVAFSADGSTLASCHFSGKLIVWDVRAKRRLVTRQVFDTRALRASFAPDGKTIACVGEQSAELRILDAATLDDVMTLTGHTANLGDVAFSPDGKLLASGDHDGMVRLWEATSGRVLHVLNAVRGGGMRLTFTPDSGRIVTAGGDGRLRVWDAKTGQLIRLIDRVPVHWRAVAISRDGRILAANSDLALTCFWDLSSGQPLGARYHRLVGEKQKCYTLAFTADSQYLLAGCQRHVMRMPVAPARHTSLRGQREPRAAAFSPDGRTLATGGADGYVKLWDANLYCPSGVIQAHQGPCYSLAYFADGRWLVTGGADHTVKLWDPGSGQLVRTLEHHNGPVRSVAVSPLGIVASAGDDGAVLLWDGETGRLLRTLVGHTGPARSVAFAPDGRRVAAAGQNAVIIVWEVETGRTLRTLAGHTEPINQIAFAPDGRSLASGSHDDSIRIWPLDRDHAPRTLKGPIGPILSVAYSPDGKNIASVGTDRRLWLWDAATGEPLISVTGHEDTVLSVAFSPAGGVLATTSRDGWVFFHATRPPSR